MKTTRSAQAAADASCVTITSVRPPASTVSRSSRSTSRPGAPVQRAGRLVGEHDLRLAHERPGDRDALLLAAGELRGAVAGAVAEPDLRERLADRGAAEAPAGEPRGQRDVLRRGQRAEQVERLEDEADVVAPQRRERALAHRAEVAAAELRAARRGAVEPGGDLQQRRLAGARRPHHGGERPAVEGERDAVERAHRALAAAEDAHDVVEAQQRVAAARGGGTVAAMGCGRGLHEAGSDARGVRQRSQRGARRSVRRVGRRRCG